MSEKDLENEINETLGHLSGALPNFEADHGDITVGLAYNEEDQEHVGIALQVPTDASKHRANIVLCPDEALTIASGLIGSVQAFFSAMSDEDEDDDDSNSSC